MPNLKSKAKKSLEVQLILPNGDEVKNATVEVRKNQRVKQVREKLLRQHFSKNKEYDTVLKIPSTDGESRFLDDDDDMWPYTEMLTKLKHLELSYISWTPVFSQWSTPLGLNMDIGMVCGSPHEASVVAMQIPIHYPNGDVIMRQLHLLDRPVEDTKTVLLETENPVVNNYLPFEDMMMELHFANQSPKEMFDKDKLRDYLFDMGGCDFIKIKKKPVFIM